jgi:signal peptide peptidase SppA
MDKVSKIISILNSPLLIKESSFYSIVEVYNKYRSEEKIKIGKPNKKNALTNENENNKENKPYQVINGKAIINIDGVLMKNPGSFLKMCFGVIDMVEIGQNVKMATRDMDVQVILLKVDSPGGTVEGTEETARIVRQAAEMKPVITYVDGMMASGAYWIGSAAHDIFISGKTAELGSIGVATYHADKSEFYAKQGIKFTHIYAGKYKRMVVNSSPLSEEGQQYIQDQVDGIYTIMVDDIALNRGTSVEKVLSQMADGKIFLGDEAIRVGLADGVMPFEDVLALDVSEINLQRRTNKNNKTEVLAEMTITVDEIRDKHPDIFAEIKAIGAKEVQADFDKKSEADLKAEFDKGVTAENKRVSEIYSHIKPGREKVIGECIEDKEITAGDAAIRILDAHDKAMEKKATDILGDLPDSIEHDTTPEKKKESEKDTSKMTVEERAKHEYATNEEVRKEFSSEEVYVAYCKRKNPKEDN